MATGGDRGKKGNDSSGSGKINGLAASLVFGGGALAGAVLLYGVKKLYDYLSTSEKEQLQKKLDEEDEDFGPPRSRRSDLSHSVEDDFYDEQPSLMHMSYHSGGHSPRAVENEAVVSPLSDGASSYLSASSLHDSLLDYYTSYVDIPEMDQALACTVVDDVMVCFQYVLDELLPNTPLSGMVSSGPSAEGLNVVRPDFFQVTLQLQLDPKLWEFVDAGNTLLGAHGYLMVKRTHLEFFSRGVTRYDKYLIGEYLSPLKIKSALLDVTNRVNNWGSRFTIRSAVIGPSVKLHVTYGEEEGKKRTLTVEFVPGVKLGDAEVLATTHGRVLQKPGYDNLWMQSFAAKEYEHLSSWRPNPSPASSLPDEEASSDNTPDTVVEALGTTESQNDNEQETDQIDVPGDAGPTCGCQMMCLKLLEAVRLNHPAQLGLLTPYMVRTIVMHLMTFEDGWLQEELSERFLDTLKALEEYLRARNLPHFFCPKLNLFEDLDPETLELAREFIAATVGNNQFPTLLKTNY